MKPIFHIIETMFWLTLICSASFFAFYWSEILQNGLPLLLLLGQFLFIHLFAKRGVNFHDNFIISKNPKRYLTDKDPEKRRLAKKYLK